MYTAKTGIFIPFCNCITSDYRDRGRLSRAYIFGQFLLVFIFEVLKIDSCYHQETSFLGRLMCLFTGLLDLLGTENHGICRFFIRNSKKTLKAHFTLRLSQIDM